MVVVKMVQVYLDIGKFDLWYIIQFLKTIHTSKLVKFASIFGNFKKNL